MSEQQQQTMEIESIITKTIDGKEVKMKYNRYIKKYEKLPEEPIITKFPNDQIEFIKLPDGTSRGWFENRQLKFESLPDGTERDWYKDGQIRSEYLPEGIERCWYPNGQIAVEEFAGGPKRVWHSNGQLKYERINGIETKYRDNGKIYYHSTNGKEDTKSYLKARERREVLRKMIAKKIDERDAENPKAKKERVIKHNLWTKLKVALKAKSPEI